jgi:hypothetical protein
MPPQEFATKVLGLFAFNGIFKSGHQGKLDYSMAVSTQHAMQPVP